MTREPETRRPGTIERVQHFPVRALGLRRVSCLAALLAAGTGLWLAAQEPGPSLPDTAPIVLAAGDIAKCEILGGAIATARLLDRHPGTILTLGDNAYESGTPEEFEKCYVPTWGRHVERTRPAPGNHEYLTRNAAGYFGYFGERAGPAGLGYYSFDLGTWHVVSLNTAIPFGRRSPQGKWLADDLAAHPVDCILAYWHIPAFSSGPHGDNLAVRELWRQLAEAGADVALSGHDHHYERFAPMDARGRADPVNGMRQFVVGTGGGGVYRWKRISSNSEVRDNSTYGVLKLVLWPGRYDWTFVPVEGQAFTDAGTGTCSAARATK